MPELPEVETTKTSLAPLLGQQLLAIEVFQPKLRWPIPNDLQSIIGYTLQAVERRAKYLIVTFIPNESSKSTHAPLSKRQLIMHLGMSGSLQQYPLNTDKRKHDHLIITFSAADGTPAADRSCWTPRRRAWRPAHAFPLCRHETG